MNDHSRIETLLENLPPGVSPRLERRLASAPWTPRSIRRRQTFTLISLTIVLLIAFLGLTSQGRALAQTIFKLFTTTDQSSIPLSDQDLEGFFSTPPAHPLSLVAVTPIPVTTGHCSIPEETGTYKCEIQHLEKQLNVDLKEFSTMLPGMAFIKVQLYSEVTASVLATHPPAWFATYSVVEISYQNRSMAIY
jgi:hypothetical protein